MRLFDNPVRLVHWLRPGKPPEIACGVSLNPRKAQPYWTTNPHKATCPQCRRLAAVEKIMEATSG